MANKQVNKPTDVFFVDKINTCIKEIRSLLHLLEEGCGYVEELNPQLAE